MCQHDLEKPAGKGRGYSREISEVGEGLALVLTLSQSTNVSSTKSTSAAKLSVHTFFFKQCLSFSFEKNRSLKSYDTASLMRL